MQSLTLCTLEDDTALPPPATFVICTVYWCVYVGLQALVWSGNGLVVMPQAVTGLTAMRTLFLNQNMLGKGQVTFSGNWKQLTALCHLDVSRNYLQDADVECLWACASLEVLNLQHNQLRTITAKVVQLIHLKELDMQHNKITSVSPGLVRLAQGAGKGGGGISGQIGIAFHVLSAD